MQYQYLVILIICACACFGENTKICENKQDLLDVRIPMGRLFTHEMFIDSVTNKTLKQAYILLQDPAPFTVSTNYNCEITAIDATTFQRICTGLEPDCVEYDLTLTTVSHGNSISFTYTDPSSNVLNEYYWSPCPEKFILRMQCSDVNLQQNNKCAISGTRITVFLVGDVDLNNAPWNDISMEIFTATGVKFGDIDGMKWYFTESSNTPCVA